MCSGEQPQVGESDERSSSYSREGLGHEAVEICAMDCDCIIDVIIFGVRWSPWPTRLQISFCISLLYAAHFV